MQIPQKKLYAVEFILLFVVFPIALCLKFPIWIKGALGLFGLIYVLRILLIARYSFFKKGLQFSSNKYVYKVVLIFFAIIFTSSLYMHYFKPDKLFYVVRNNLKLWIFILFVYSFLSVLPQEIIYRSFFFERYTMFFKNKHFLILINALVFSLGHLFFQNTLVLGITFVGGLIFGYSYLKSKSLLLVSFEHALYGCWLFTVGMGGMLGFPGN